MKKSSWRDGTYKEHQQALILENDRLKEENRRLSEAIVAVQNAGQHCKDSITSIIASLGLNLDEQPEYGIPIVAPIKNPAANLFHRSTSYEHIRINSIKQPLGTSLPGTSTKISQSSKDLRPMPEESDDFSQFILATSPSKSPSNKSPSKSLTNCKSESLSRQAWYSKSATSLDSYTTKALQQQQGKKKPKSKPKPKNTRTNRVYSLSKRASAISHRSKSIPEVVIQNKNIVVVMFRPENEQERLNFIRFIEGYVNIMPSLKRIEWYHGFCSLCKHGDGLYLFSFSIIKVYVFFWFLICSL
jgi:hypothetical protein